MQYTVKYSCSFLYKKFRHQRREILNKIREFEINMEADSRAFLLSFPFIYCLAIFYSSCLDVESEKRAGTAQGSNPLCKLVGTRGARHRLNTGFN
jgi:hypothetical protein